jgi:molecular chaperone DnaK (HSP70)
MALSTRTLLLLVVGVSLAICFLPTARSLVFGLDFGSRWVKMSVIRGNSFEIILDAQTKRKFMSGLAFHDDERFFAADAEKVVRSPTQLFL